MNCGKMFNNTTVPCQTTMKARWIGFRPRRCQRSNASGHLHQNLRLKPPGLNGMPLGKKFYF